MNMKIFYKYLIDIFYPNRCPCCDKIISWNSLICPECEDRFPVIENKICDKCGKTECICDKKLFYDMCFAATYYEGIIKKGIINLKLNNGINFAEYFANILFHKISDAELIDKIDIVTAVPMSKSKLSKRGYNQAEELAKIIAKLSDKLFVNNIISIRDDASEQHRLSYSQRQEAVKGKYMINNKININNKGILICDDIITTGATLNECSRLLKEKKAEYVFCANIATTNKIY